jgi:lauroyl/myristoyl acyltransferase
MLSDSVKVSAPGMPPGWSEAAMAPPWLQKRDILVVALLVVLGLVAFCLPERSWPGLARAFARKRLARSAKLSGEELETIKVVVGQGEAKAAWIEASFRTDWLAHKYLSWIQILACYRPWPWRWRPQPTLAGRQHLEDALARGNGVVLLTANFVYKDLMTKAALTAAGFGASHLVRDSHGFAESRLGKALLNPLYAGIERRFLRERLVFSGSDTGAVNQLIRARLRDNWPILVTVTPLGRRVSTLPFLHGRIRIATGALNFACEAGAEVLPVFTIQKPDGSYETIVEPPLARPPGMSRGEAIAVMLDDYVPRLETYVAQNPEQFAFPTSDRHGRALIEPRGAATSRTRTAALA